MSSESSTWLGRIFPRIGKPGKTKRAARQRNFRRRLGAEMLEDRRMLAGILSVVPNSAIAGTDDLLVSLTLDGMAIPPLPPAQIAPSSAAIGTIQGTNVTRNGNQVTATVDIPAGEVAGTKDVAVYFPDPFGGTIAYTLPAGFSVLAGGLPVVTVSATDASAAEAGLDTGTFTITRSGVTEGDLTVSLALGGSASEGDDFLTLARSVVIPDGHSSVVSTLTPVDDDIAETNESVTLTISADAAYAVGTARSATVRIADDDSVVSGGTYRVVDTGQTIFYGNTGEISAPAEGSAFYGQDAQYDGNQASYTLGADGLTVDDNVTGLTWTQSPDLDGDGDIDVKDKVTFTEAQAYPDTLNAMNYGGYSDWRLPTIKELYSLMDFSGVDPSGYSGTDTSGLVPFIDTDYFDFAYGDTSAGERIIDAQMASSTLYVGNTAGDGGGSLFGVNFADGRIKGYGLTLFGSDKTFYAYFVRGNTGYGENDFAAGGDGTVTDNATELMWSQDDSGMGMNWEDALAWVEQKNAENYLGHDDWRLPNVKELQSIVDYTRSPSTTGSPAIDPVFNTTSITIEDGSTDYPFFWSGTTHANWTNNAGSAAAYVSFGEAMGYMNRTWVDVHGAGAQRSDPKDGDPDDWPTGNGPQGDAIRINNFVRLVRDADDSGDQNVAPTANASGPYSGQVGDTISLNGSASTDSDGTIAAYAWDLDNDGQYDDASGVTANFVAGTAGSFTVGLRVTDDDGATDTDIATVTVSEIAVSNQPPEVVNPISDQTTRANRCFRLALAPDTFVDPDVGQSLTYAATQADGSPLPRWLAFNSQTRTFSGRPLVRDVGQYDIRVTATDSGAPALSAATEFSINVESHPVSCQNADLPQDVDGSDRVTAQDALILINWINAVRLVNGSGSVADMSPAAPDGSLSFVDVNGDDFVSPIDVLIVINYINGGFYSGIPAGEGEEIPLVGQVYMGSATTTVLQPVESERVSAEESPIDTRPGQSLKTGLPDADRDEVFRRYSDLGGLDDEDELLDLLACNAETDVTVFDNLASGSPFSPLVFVRQE